MTKETLKTFKYRQNTYKNMLLEYYIKTGATTAETTFNEVCHFSLVSLIYFREIHESAKLSLLANIKTS